MLLHISSEPNAPPEDRRVISSAVDDWNIASTGISEEHNVCIFLRDERHYIRGGLLGHIWGGWFQVRFLWVEPDLKGQDYGSRLLQAAEAEARHHGAQGAYLETFSFQAKPFYEKHGYIVFASIEDFPPGHYYYLMRKSFSPAERDEQKAS